MTTNRRGNLPRAVLARCWLVLGLTACTPLLAQEVIVNADVPERSVSWSTLRAIFSMHLRQWSDGKPIRVFVLPPTTRCTSIFPSACSW